MHRKRYNYCMNNVKCILSTMSQYIAQKHTSLQIISIRNIFFHMIIKDYKYSHLMFIITYYVLSIMKKMWTLILWLGTTNQLCRYIFHIRCWQVFTSNMYTVLHFIISLLYKQLTHSKPAYSWVSPCTYQIQQSKKMESCVSTIQPIMHQTLLQP